VWLLAQVARNTVEEHNSQVKHRVAICVVASSSGNTASNYAKQYNLHAKKTKKKTIGNTPVQLLANAVSTVDSAEPLITDNLTPGGAVISLYLTFSCPLYPLIWAVSCLIPPPKPMILRHHYLMNCLHLIQPHQFLTIYKLTLNTHQCCMFLQTASTCVQCYLVST
jgi:hypothetical protein